MKGLIDKNNEKIDDNYIFIRKNKIYAKSYIQILVIFHHIILIII